MAGADYGRRLSETRKRMSDSGLDGLLVSNPSNRRYLTGFTPRDGDITETSGWVLVTPKSLGVIAGPFYGKFGFHQVSEIPITGSAVRVCAMLWNPDET